MAKKEERPLDPVYQDAESAFAGGLAAIEQAAANTRARKPWALVLRWYYEHGAQHHPVVSKAREIAKSYWLGLSERSVQLAHAHWKKLGVLTFEPRTDDNGSNLPPWASLNWRTVVQLACVQSAGTARRISTGDRVTESRRETADRDGSFYLTDGERDLTPHSPGDGERAPSPGERAPSPGERAPSPGLALAWRSHKILLACARASSTVTDTVTVVDDDCSVRTATREMVADLATDMGRLIWNTIPHEAWKTLYAAAAAAKLLISDAWALKSAEAAAADIRCPGSKVTKPLKFLWGTLRVNVEKIGGVEKFESKEESRNWFGAFLFPFEEATAAWLPSAEIEPPPKAKGPSIYEASAEERRAGSETIRAVKAEMQRRAANSKPQNPKEDVRVD